MPQCMRVMGRRSVVSVRCDVKLGGTNLGKFRNATAAGWQDTEMQGTDW